MAICHRNCHRNATEIATEMPPKIPKNTAFCTFVMAYKVRYFGHRKTRKALKNQHFPGRGGGGWIRTTVGIASRFTGGKMLLSSNQ